MPSGSNEPEPSKLNVTPSSLSLKKLSGFGSLRMFPLLSVLQFSIHVILIRGTGSSFANGFFTLIVVVSTSRLGGTKSSPTVKATS